MKIHRIILHQSFAIPVSHKVPLKPGGQSQWKELKAGVVQVPPFMQGLESHSLRSVKDARLLVISQLHSY